MPVTITNIKQNSLAEQAKLSRGDKILKINGKLIHDELDYNFYSAEESLNIEIMCDGKMRMIQIKDLDYRDLGIELEPMKMRKCANDCIFCFVDQLPSGLRSSLSFRDGDYRFSFLHGHYITLTNVGRKGLERIAEQHLSPLYISVHATDIETRLKMLLYGKNDNLMEKLRFFVDNNIEFHTQIVLCPDLNDGAILEKTIADLMSLVPSVLSIALVPIGLTAHRTNLPNITPYNRESALELIEKAKKWDSLKNTDGHQLLQIADEFFWIAKLDYPNGAYYGDFRNIENGVGLVRSTLDDFKIASTEFPSRIGTPKTISIATGIAAAEIFKKEISGKLNAIENLTVNIFSVNNTIFGEPVTVANLLGGKCFINALKGADLGELVILPPQINNEDELMIDDFTVDRLGQELRTIVTPFSGDYHQLWKGTEL